MNQHIEINAQELKNRAFGNWAYILGRLGIDKEYLKKGAQTPCPACGGTDRFKFDDKTINLTYYCNGCGAGSGFDLIMKTFLVDFRDSLFRVHNVLGDYHNYPLPNVANNTDPLTAFPPSNDKVIHPAKMKMLLGMVNACRPTVTKPALQYLDKRGIKGMNNRHFKSIKYGSLSYGLYGALKKDDKYLKFPVMLGLFSKWNSRTLGVVQIFVKPDDITPHLPADRVLVSKPLFNASNLSGCGVWLSKTKNKVLHVVEGLENALSIASMLKTRCVVAGITASLLGSLDIPEHVETIYIWSDNDKAGADSGVRLFERYENKEIYIHTPKDVQANDNQDWNDLLLMGGYQEKVQQLVRKD